MLLHIDAHISVHHRGHINENTDVTRETFIVLCVGNHDYKISKFELKLLTGLSSPKYKGISLEPTYTPLNTMQLNPPVSVVTTDLYQL